MSPSPSTLRRWGRTTLLAIGVSLGLVASGVIAGNALLNFGLPLYLNAVSKRVHVQFAWAWMIVPGHVVVHHLHVTSLGQRGQIVVTADRASGWIALAPLWSRSFHASGVRARGVTFMSQPYGDEPVRHREATPREPSSEEEDGDVLDPAPTASEGADPPLVLDRWSVRLDDIVAVDLREIRYHDYRLLGHADVTASVAVDPPYVDLEADVTFLESRIAITGDVVADRATGTASLRLSRVDQRLPSADKIAALSGGATLQADVRDLRFLDFYLKDVPWLSFGGIGTTRLSLGLDAGQLMPGTELEADFPDLIVRLLGTVVRGSGTIRGAVREDEAGVPYSRVSVDLLAFDLVTGDQKEPLIRGESLLIDLRSPDTALFAPFAVDVTVILPPSSIPSVAGFNPFLPAEIGLELVSGAGTVRGELRSTAKDGRGWGALHIASGEVVARLDDLDIVTEVEVAAVLADAHFEDGRYALAGTKVHLRRLGVRDRTDPDGRFVSHGWASTLSIASGTIALKQPLYLDVSMNLWSTDSGPFVAVLSQKQRLPKWAQGAMTVDGLVGEGRVRLGPTSLEIGPFALRGGDAYEFKLRYLKDGSQTYGAVFTRAGPLSVGIGLHPSGSNVHLFRATRWFDEQERTRAWRR